MPPVNPNAGAQWNPNAPASSVRSDSGIERVRSMNTNISRPMPAGALSFTGNPVDRQMYGNFAVQPGSAIAASTLGSSTYQK